MQAYQKGLSTILEAENGGPSNKGNTKTQDAGKVLEALKKATGKTTFSLADLQGFL